MAPGLTLDAAALILVERRNRDILAVLKRCATDGTPITIPAPVVAQVWRGKEPLVARVIDGAEVEPFDEALAKAVGVLLAASGTADVVDAAVVVGAIRRGDAIATSDFFDIRRLLDASGRSGRGVRVIHLR